MPAAAAVNTVGAATRNNTNGKPKVGAATGVAACKICSKPGHNARDCLLFMQREGTCGHWFMHSIGIYRTGCTYGTACIHKHERPSNEPPENGADADVPGTPVSTMATGAIPNTNGAKPVLKEMTNEEGKEKKSVRAPQARRLEPAPEAHWEPQGTPDHSNRTKFIKRASRTRTRFNRSISIL